MNDNDDRRRKAGWGGDDAGPDGENPEKTPGGSRSIRHGQPRRLPFGVPEHPTLPYIEKREAVYEGMFGPYEVVSDEILPRVPHIDVYVHPPGFGGRDFCTLVTGGMSDLRMNVTADAPAEVPVRVELIFYLPGDAKPEDRYVDFLRTAAQFPYAFDTWLAWGHTIPNGTPPQPIFEGSPFDTLLFIDTPVAEPDGTLPERLVLDGDPVHFLFVVPITSAERRYKLEHGTDALLDVFDEVQHPFAFHDQRRSYIE